ncbi:MAG: divalent metal cation transporter [Proteobacteria bacterium]|nr:divalent metal cation transporter [Pseudomonadota bacterium]
MILFFALMGPGIITSMVDNDAGGITTYSLAGAEYGKALLWSLIPITLALIVVQEMCARMGVVTGKGLSDLIRERFGARITFYLMIVLVLTNLVWWLVVKGTYKSVEKVFLGACFFYAAYIICGFIIKPDWGDVARQLVTPTFSMDARFLTMLIAVVGTTIAPWMQFYLQSSIVDKGLKVGDYRYARFDVIQGSIIVNVVAFFIIVVCAATLFRDGIRIETAKDAALSLYPLAGKYCSWLFAFGLLNASLFAASILPLSTAYFVCEGLGWEASIDRKFIEAPQFYAVYSLMILIGAGTILLPNFPLIKIMLFSQVLNGIVLPVILIFMLILINDKKLMGHYTNGPIFNAIAWSTTAIMIVLSIFLAVSPLKL